MAEFAICFVIGLVLSFAGIVIFGWITDLQTRAARADALAKELEDAEYTIQTHKDLWTEVGAIVERSKQL